jgi:hypothetical protein
MLGSLPPGKARLRRLMVTVSAGVFSVGSEPPPGHRVVLLAVFRVISKPPLVANPAAEGADGRVVPLNESLM